MNASLQSAARAETARLRALEQYQLPEAADQLGLEEITQIAADLCGTPIAGISLILANTISFEGRIGPGPLTIPRGHMPCEICIHGDEVYEIKDARYHPDFSPDGMLVSGRVFRFYAGAPLTTPEGINIGCLFVQGTQPQVLTDRQRESLMALARQVMTRFELSIRVRAMDSGDRDLYRVESALSVERNFVSTVLDTVGRTRRRL